MIEIRNAEEILDEVIDLLNHLPIQQAASAEEPWCKLNMIDITMIRDVAEGRTRKADWVSVYCNKNFDHSPHHWSDYKDGREPLRIPHYCNGETAMTTTAEATLQQQVADHFNLVPVFTEDKVDGSDVATLRWSEVWPILTGEAQESTRTREQKRADAEALVRGEDERRARRRRGNSND